MVRALFLLLAALLLGAPTAEAGLPYWRQVCEKAYARLHPQSAARREKIARINLKIADLRAQYEAALPLERVGDAGDAEFLRQQLEELWNLRAKEGEGYRVIPVQSKYVGEQNALVARQPAKVKYLTPAEREQYRIHADAEGRLRRADGSLLSTCYRKATGNGYECVSEIFVMDADGGLYSLEKDHFFPDGTLRRHSSVLGGLPAASAGQWQLIDGVPVYMDAQSGHYAPRPAVFRQVLEQFKKLLVPTTGYPIEADVAKFNRPAFVF